MTMIFEKAKQLYDTGKYSETVEIIDRLCGDSLNSEVIRLKANALLLIGKIDESRKNYIMALEMDNSDTKSMRNLAKLELLQGNLEEALELVERAIHLDGKNNDLVELKAQVYIRMNNLEEGIILLEEVFASDKNKKIAKNLIDSYFSQGIFTRCLDILKEFRLVNGDKSCLCEELEMALLVNNEQSVDEIVRIVETLGEEKCKYEKLLNIASVYKDKCKSVIYSIQKFSEKISEKEERYIAIYLIVLKNKHLTKSEIASILIELLDQQGDKVNIAVLVNSLRDFRAFDMFEILIEKSLIKSYDHVLAGQHFVYATETYEGEKKYEYLKECAKLFMNAEYTIIVANYLYMENSRENAILTLIDFVETKGFTKEICICLSAFLGSEKLYNEALEVIDKAIDIDENCGWSQRCAMLRELGRLEEAETAGREAIKRNLDSGLCYMNLGCVYWDKGEIKKAIKMLNEAIGFDNTRVKAMSNLGGILSDLGRYDEAVALLEKVINQDEDDKNANLVLGSIRLREYDFENAWPLWQKRLVVVPDRLKYMDNFVVGYKKRPYIVAEQGIGDEITFACVLHELIEECEYIVWECDPRLTELLKHSFKEKVYFTDRFSGDLEAYDKFKCDSFIAAGSLLPIMRKKKESFEKQHPYIKADDDLTHYYREKLGKGQKTIVGISWKSELKRYLNKMNSIDVTELVSRIADKDNVLVNLQYGDIKKDIEKLKENKLDLIEMEGINIKEDIYKLASLVNACDYVVTTPNITPGLSGSLGKKTIMLLPKGGPRWRWPTSGSQGIWFPSVQLVRQKEQGEWENELESLNQITSQRQWLI